MSPLRGRHLWLIGTHSARHAIRGGSGLVFIFLTLVCGLAIAQAIIGPLELGSRILSDHTGAMPPDEAMQQIVQVGRGVVSWALGETSSAEDLLTGRSPQGKGSQRWTSYLLDEKPALLSVILLLLIFSLPFLVPLGAFNQVSGDVQSRGLRYLLLRTERGNIFFGRFLGTAIFCALVMGLLVAVIALYLGLKVRLYDAGPLIAWSLWGMAALAILTLPYVALCAWISTVIDSPFGSLSISNTVILGVLLVAGIIQLQVPQGAYLLHLLPWGIQNHLLHPDLLHWGGAVLACLGYTALFLFLGHRHFMTRDL